ncbi:GNAT family N-acetyltransferase [Paenibacillus sp. LHD-38]|uniref:GNAT family N-acetyltransferase n=1 Tax=Paenibacillus sp. LHD-38 TaxID=3072143 RepID=UPI0035BE5F87
MRCRLDYLQKSDYEHVKKLYTNEDVRKYLGGIIPETLTLNKFLETLDRANANHSFYWVVTLKEDEQFIGLVSLENHRMVCIWRCHTSFYPIAGVRAMLKK